MGQAASKKAVEISQRAAAAAAPRASQAQRTRAAAQEEWRRSSAAAPPPPPEGEYSPTRGEQYRTSSEAEAEAEAGGEGSVPEMPPDLVQFLNDAGPLQRTVDESRTSPKVYDALVADEKARDEQTKQANQRVRRKMPILSSQADGAREDDGSMTERTTNFSTVDRSAEGKGRLGVTREDLFRLSGEVRGLKIGSPEWKKKMELEYKNISKNGTKKKDFDQLQDMALFENSLRYIGVPVLVKDTDGDILGLWNSKAQGLKHSFGLKAVPEGSLEFSMLTEGEPSKKM